MKNVVVAEKSGFCFGVKRAVDKAISISKKYGDKKRIYTFGPLIHNNDVVKSLKNKKVYPIKEEDIDKLEAGDIVIIRSHGVSPKIYDLLNEKKVEVIDATCPFVSNIHSIVKNYYDSGYGIVIVGDKNHPEVIGTNGWCNNKALISKDGSTLKNIPSKVCIVSQTTEKSDDWDKAVDIVIRNSKEVAVFNTICSATEIRQKSAEDLSKKVDAMLVIGGKNSSNTTKLFEICKKYCENTVHIENSSEIPDDIISSDRIKNVGITAGASTPDWIIEEAINKMNDSSEIEKNEQLRYMNENNTQIAVGDEVTGEVISLNDKELFLNIGYKSDGILPLEEVTKDENVKLTDLYKVGDHINVKIISIHNEDGYVVLSKIELERKEAFNEIETAFKEKTVLNVKVKEAVKGGLLASYKGIRIFIPASHVELTHVDDLSQYVDKTFDVNIIEFNKSKRKTRIVGSRRSLLKVKKEEQEEETWKILKQGDIVDGEVKRLTDFGAFVDVNGVDGLLHVSEISWGKVDKPSDVLKTGDKIKAYILNVDPENKKLSLSIKHTLEDPWENIDKKYPVGSIVLGKVLRFASFGAFVELEPGVDGLVHISQISHKRINAPSDVLEIGQQVKAKILDVNKEDKKIGLSIKETDEI